jgi:hypothetical protein
MFSIRYESDLTPLAIGPMDRIGPNQGNGCMLKLLSYSSIHSPNALDRPEIEQEHPWVHKTTQCVKAHQALGCSADAAEDCRIDAMKLM